MKSTNLRAMREQVFHVWAHVWSVAKLGPFLLLSPPGLPPPFPPPLFFYKED